MTVTLFRSRSLFLEAQSEHPALRFCCCSCRFLFISLFLHLSGGSFLFSYISIFLFSCHLNDLSHSPLKFHQTEKESCLQACDCGLCILGQWDEEGKKRDIPAGPRCVDNKQGTRVEHVNQKSLH